MTTSTLHLNNPVPSNGAVVSSLGGRHTVTVTLAGVGAISCVVQAWGSEQGTDSRKIGAPVTVSGTTTVSQTLTFDADCKQFWLELVKLSPACKFNATVENDGTLVADYPIVAPNVQRYPVVTTPRTVTQRLRGDGLRACLHGSSTLANGSTYQLLGGVAGDRKQCTNSLIWALNAHGAEIDEVWNGAFSGDKTASIEAKFNADWARTVGGVQLRDAWDVEFFAPAFNNLTDPTDDLVSAKAAIVRMLRKMVRYGKRVVWIMPFAGNPLSSTGATHARYQAYRAWMYATIEAEQGYRGQILPWDLYEIFCSGGVDTPMQYLEGQLVPVAFAQHLTNIGVTYAARHPLSRDLISYLQIPRVEGQDIYGTPVAAMDMTTVTAGTNLTITSAGDDPDTGEPMYDITSAGTLSQALTGAITVDTAKMYRFVGEYELIAKRTAAGDDYVDGIKWEDPIAQRIGIWPWINSQSIPYSDRELGRVKVFGPKWKPNDTSGSIRLFPGPAGAVVRVRGNTPIRLYEVPA